MNHQHRAIARAILGGALFCIRELSGRTAIAVTHRSAASALCDWRMEVADGKIRGVPAGKETES